MTRLDLNTVTLAGRLIVQAAVDGIAVDHVSLNGRSLSIYAEDRSLAPALAVSLGLTKRTETALDSGLLEQFTADVEGVHVRTHGPIPITSMWTCPCGARGWLVVGASDEDRVAYDESAALHDECRDDEVLP
jgi:hypothetical protein